MSSLYSKLFAKYYDKFMLSFEAKIAKDRRKMLQNLTGKVLDVGSGTGVNFEFFNDKVEVLAVEPSKEMQAKSVVKIGDKNIQLINLGVNNPKLHTIIKEKSLDAIICTLVLCTVPDPALAIDNFKKWLKPEGKLIVLEHIHSDKKGKAILEKMINPLWKKFAEGCNLTRNTDILIKQKGFIPKRASYFTLGLRIVKGVYLIKPKRCNRTS